MLPFIKPPAAQRLLSIWSHRHSPRQHRGGQGACPGQRPGEDCACGCAAPNTRRLGSQRNPCLNAQIPPRHTSATVRGLLPQDHQTQPSKLPQHRLGSPCPCQPQPALSILTPHPHGAGLRWAASYWSRSSLLPGHIPECCPTGRPPPSAAASCPLGLFS